MQSFRAHPIQRRCTCEVKRLPKQLVTALGRAGGVAGLFVGLSSSATAQDDAAPASDEELQLHLEQIQQELEELKRQMNALEPGYTRFLVTGRASVNFTAREHDESTFTARLNPVLLWKLSDQLLAGTSFELRAADDDSDVELQWANLSLVLSDNLTLRGGLFLTPLSYFQEQLYPAAINKLPDKPIFATGRGQIIPESSLGFELRGAAPIGSTKVTYSAYIANGPALETSGPSAGQFDFRNFSDVNDSKAIGAQVGWLPVANLEFVYGIQFADVAPDSGTIDDTNVLLHSFAVNYLTEDDWLKGRLDARAEFDFADFDGLIDLGAGPFNNDRTGGYAQVAYRPTHLGSIMRDLEGVFRWDFLNQSSDAPQPQDQQRYTVGLNYWVAPTTVLKVAYQFSDIDDPTGQRESDHAVLFQLGMGF
ncbi:MAG: hypothetical protein L0Y42_12390 [Phycisphaerales bacterium]|nr:hypothetical protein [Phycisphaerales bacterium]